MSDDLEPLLAAAETEPVVTLRQARRTLLLCGLVIGLVLAVLIGVAVYQFTQMRKASDALCTFRGDLQSRVDQSNAFLRQHPNGFAGIGARDIQTSINNEQRTIDALRGLSC